MSTTGDRAMTLGYSPTSVFARNGPKSARICKMKGHCYSPILLPLIVIFLLLVSASARPSAALSALKATRSRSQQAQDATRLSRITNGAERYPRTIRYESVHKRMMPGLAPNRLVLKRLYFQTLTAMVPVTAPAKFLENFFSSIAIKADPERGEWGSLLPRREAFTVVEGSLRLSFSAVGDTIPWDFVKDFADKLWECAVVGVTQLFQTVYMDDTGTVGVQISLTLIDESSVGSGSGSATGYREGSWDSITSPGGGT